MCAQGVVGPSLHGTFSRTGCGPCRRRISLFTHRGLPLIIDMVSEHASPLAALGGADGGGQNVHVAALAVALGRRGHQITVFTRRSDESLPDKVRIAPGVTVEHVSAGAPGSR